MGSTGPGESTGPRRIHSVRLRPPSRPAVLALLARSATAPLSYAEVGISLEDRTPPVGWGVSTGSAELGRGEAVWTAAVAALHAWDAHRGARVRLEPPTPEIREGVLLAVTAGLPLGSILGLCRIVRVVDEPDRYGFAYGTLDPHPEVGEESFLLTRGPGGEVRFTARSVSRAVALPARLVPPLARLAIAAYTRVYARAFAAAVARRQHAGR